MTTMSRFQSAPFARDLQTLCRLGAVGGSGDGVLLARFVSGDGEARDLAFAALVDRHGPMVFRVCLGVLKDRHDAEDAAQATFLVLARRARSIRRADSLGPWLHGVALRTASRARAGATRRREIERKAAEDVAMRERVENRFSHEAELHEEIDRLPARYKAAIVACDLEGLTHAQAAERLRLPIRTLETRLYRGRDRLRVKLIRRGVGLASVEAVLTLGKPAEAALSAAWKEATARAAVTVLEGASPVAASLVAERVLAWSQGGVTAKTGVIALSVVAVLASSGLLIAGASLARHKPDDPPVAQAPARLAARKDDAPNPIIRPLPAPDEIKQVLREASDAAIALSREQVGPGSSPLPLIATAQARVGDRDGGLKTLRAAEAVGDREERKPISNWSTKLATAQRELGLNDEARRTFQEAARTASQMPADLRKAGLSVHELTMIVRTQLMIAGKEQARDTVKRLETLMDGILAASPELGVLFLRDLAAAQTMVGDLDGALVTVDRAAADPVRGDQLRRIVLASIAQESEVLDPRDGRRVVDRLHEELERTKEFEAKREIQRPLVGLLARVGDAEEAYGLAREIAEGGSRDPRAVAFEHSQLLQRASHAQWVGGDLAGMCESLRRAVEAIPDYARSDQDGANWCQQLASDQVRAGDLDGALKTLATLDRGKEGGLTLSSIAWQFSLEGKTDRAVETLQKAREEAAAAREALPANLKLAPMLDRSAGPVLMRTAVVHALAAEVDQALAAARSISDKDRRGQALAMVVSMRARAGDLREALELALSFDSPDDRRHALESLASGLLTRLKAEEQLKKPDEVKPKEER